jgi:predicted nucleotidyltransferase
MGHYKDGHVPTPEEFFATLAEAVDVLEAHGIRYVLMGGIGAASMARPRTTDDIDVFVRPDDAPVALEHLAAAGFEVEETYPDWLFKAFKHGVLVDIIFRSSGDIYLDEEMLRRSHRGDFKGREAQLIAPEDLLIIKALASAEHSAHHWYDALSLIGVCELDWAYLLGRARRVGPRRMLSLLLYAESNDLAVPAEVIEALFETVHPSPAKVGVG